MEDLQKREKTLTNPELARTLEAVAEGGHSAFYEGAIAETIANHIQKLGGCLTADDLKNYRPFITEPYQIQYRGYSVYTAPLGGGWSDNVTDAPTRRSVQCGRDVCYGKVSPFR